MLQTHEECEDQTGPAQAALKTPQQNQKAKACPHQKVIGCL